jgi:hypothetical protein
MDGKIAALGEDRIEVRVRNSARWGSLTLKLISVGWVASRSSSARNPIVATVVRMNPVSTASTGCRLGRRRYWHDRRLCRLNTVISWSGWSMGRICGHAGADDGDSLHRPGAATPARSRAQPASLGIGVARAGTGNGRRIAAGGPARTARRPGSADLSPTTPSCRHPDSARSSGPAAQSAAVRTPGVSAQPGCSWNTTPGTAVRQRSLSTTWARLAVA